MLAKEKIVFYPKSIDKDCFAGRALSYDECGYQKEVLKKALNDLKALHFVWGFFIKIIAINFYYILLLTDHVSISDNNIHMRNINIYKFACLNNV